MKLFGLNINVSRREVYTEEQVLQAASAMQEANPFDFEFDEPYASADAERLGRPGASWAGLYPREWMFGERLRVWTRAHQVWERDPIAKGGVKLIRSFALGTGMVLSFKSRLCELAVRELIEDEKLKFQAFEKELFDQLLIDGEIFVRFFVSGEVGKAGSKVTIRTVKPWQVEYIQTRPGDRNDVLFYHIREETGTGVPGDPGDALGGNLIAVPANEIVHVCINKLAYETRGRSELFVILPWLRAYREWLENRARINRYKGIIYHLQLKNASPEVVRSKQAQFKRPVRPGSIYVSSDFETLDSVGQNIEAGAVAEDGRQIRLQNAGGLSLPEYMLSDGQNSNLASANAQQLPALKSFEDYQDIYIQMVWIPIFRKTIERKYGDLNALDDEIDVDGDFVRDIDNSIKQVRLRDGVIVGYPNIKEKKPRDLAEALSTAAAQGWVSDETASHEMGYDYRQEVKRGAKRRERTGSEVSAVPGDDIPQGSVRDPERVRDGD